MKKYIEELKTRSYAEKNRFAFMASLGITSIVAALWFISIIINPEERINIKGDKAQELANTGSLFDVLEQSLNSLK